MPIDRLQTRTWRSCQQAHRDRHPLAPAAAAKSRRQRPPGCLQMGAAAAARCAGRHRARQTTLAVACDCASVHARKDAHSVASSCPLTSIIEISSMTRTCVRLMRACTASGICWATACGDDVVASGGNPAHSCTVVPSRADAASPVIAQMLTLLPFHSSDLVTERISHVLPVPADPRSSTSFFFFFWFGCAVSHFVNRSGRTATTDLSARNGTDEAVVLLLIHGRMRL